MPYLIAILALVVLVVLHELGHFLAAKAVGIRATKFYVFFPPALLKRKVGDVEYGIGAIPLGGFVKLPGMFRPEPGEVAERLRFEYEDVMPLVDGDAKLRLDAARREVAHADSTDDLADPLGDIREVLDVALREERADAAATDADATADADADAKTRAKVLERAVDRLDGLLDDLHPKAYWRAALWRRMSVIFAGPAVNLVVAFVVLAGFYWFMVPRYEIASPLRIDEISKSSPAAEAGITEDSRIVGWNGQIVGVAPVDLAERIQDMRGETMELVWTDADGENERTAILEPRKFEGSDGEERIGIAAAFGGGPKRFDVEVVGRERTSLATGSRIAVEEIREITVGTFTRLPRIFYDAEIREDVGSVVGIVQVAADVDRAGQLVRYVALISLILAIMNLLPLLPLDGGHLFFGLLEAVRRRPMPKAAFERFSMVGLALVLVLFFIGLDNDIGRMRG